MGIFVKNEKQLSVDDSYDKGFLSEIKNDKKKFAKLYDKYWESLFVIAFHKCRDQAMAEDCVQDVFLSLLNHKNPTSIDNLHAYLIKAVKYAILRAIYKYNRTQYLEEYPDNIEIIERSIEDAIEEKMLKEHLFNKVEELPKQCRIIFKSSRQDHLSNDEIAEMMNISKRTVENQLSKALKVLRNYLSIVFYFFLI